MKDQVPPELEVWALWRALKRIFPVWSLLPSAFWTPGAWGYVGLDHVTGLRRNATTRATFALLQDRSDEALATLTALASLNSRRQGQMFSIVAIIYITVPLTLVATWAQIARSIGSFSSGASSIPAKWWTLTTAARPRDSD